MDAAKRLGRISSGAISRSGLARRDLWVYGSRCRRHVETAAAVSTSGRQPRVQDVACGSAHIREQMIDMTMNVPIHSGVAPRPGEQPTDAPSTVDVAKDQAASVGHGAADAGQHVADVAKDQTQSVVAEAGNQATDLLRQARSELTDQANAQQQRVARGLQALGDELQSMAQRSEQPGVATDLVRQASSKSHDVASW